MIVLFDTNIILDILEKRTPFYEASSKALEYCVSGKVQGYIAVHSVSNIFYILRKRFSIADRRRLLLDVLNLLQVADASYECVKNALLRENFLDFEDCMQDECAKKINADYIITRNIKDFSESIVPAIDPIDFIKILANEAEY